MVLRRFVVPAALAALLFAFPALISWHVQPQAGALFAQSENAAPHCLPIGGTVTTNLAVIGDSTTLGTVTGDLRGAVSATILQVSPGASGTTIFTVQHHFVTEAGDTILVKPAQATVTPVTPTLFAVVTYPVEIVGGTGKFTGATGTLNNIGEVAVPIIPIWPVEQQSSGTAGRSVWRHRASPDYAHLRQRSEISGLENRNASSRNCC